MAEFDLTRYDLFGRSMRKDPMGDYVLAKDAFNAISVLNARLNVRRDECKRLRSELNEQTSTD